MNLKGKRIGFVLTGSFCTFSKTIEQIEKIVESGAEVLPVMSFNAYNLDTKFRQKQRFYRTNRKYIWEKNNKYNTRSGTNRSKKFNRHNDSGSSNRKYYSKTYTWNNRYTSINGHKITFEK